MNAEVTTKVKHLVGTAFVALVVVVSGVVAIKTVSDHARQRDQVRIEADRISNIERDYFAAARLYDTQVVQRNACLDRVESRDGVRKEMFGFNDIDKKQNATLSGILTLIDEQQPGPPSEILATALALTAAQDVAIDEQRADIDISFPELFVEDCPPMPDEIPVPESLRDGQ